MNKRLIAATALAACVMPTGFAENDTPEEGVPYTITIDGARYPAGLSNIEYPYSAGRLGLSGECQLNVHVDSSDHIAAISIASCTDERFRDASERFINSQTFVGSTASDLTSHSLSISWELDPQPTEIIIASN
ncbi:MAG: hypothetical protein AAF292_05005 [Pseudomonadota bacterium]